MDKKGKIAKRSVDKISRLKARIFDWNFVDAYIYPLINSPSCKLSK